MADYKVHKDKHDENVKASSSWVFQHSCWLHDSHYNMARSQQTLQQLDDIGSTASQHMDPQYTRILLVRTMHQGIKPCHGTVD